jgi:hypothetical protein
MDRREILKMFGIAAAAIPAAKVAAVEVLPEPTVTAIAMKLEPPLGMVYQWKRIFITADEPDLGNIAQMIEVGWKPVPAKRHLHLQTAPNTYWIEDGGLVLMEKPAKDIPPPQKYPEPEAHNTGWIKIGPDGVIEDASDQIG